MSKKKGPSCQFRKKSQRRKWGDLEEIQTFLFDKLKGEKPVRNYGEDTGWTNIEFEEDGNFHGSYRAKSKTIDSMQG